MLIGHLVVVAALFQWRLLMAMKILILRLLSAVIQRWSVRVRSDRTVLAKLGDITN